MNPYSRHSAASASLTTMPFLPSTANTQTSVAVGFVSVEEGAANLGSVELFLVEVRGWAVVVLVLVYEYIYIGQRALLRAARMVASCSMVFWSTMRGLRPWGATLLSMLVMVLEVAMFLLTLSVSVSRIVEL